MWLLHLYYPQPPTTCTGCWPKWGDKNTVGFDLAEAIGHKKEWSKFGKYCEGNARVDRNGSKNNIY